MYIYRTQFWDVTHSNLYCPCTYTAHSSGTLHTQTFIVHAHIPHTVLGRYTLKPLSLVLYLEEED